METKLDPRRGGALAALFLVVGAPPAAAQAGPWAEQVIASTEDSPMSVAAVDVDGDGDLDLFTVALFGGLTWHENLNGDASAWLARPIVTLNAPFWVTAADVDGDGDADAVTGGTNADGVVWHENVAGNGSTWAVHGVDGEGTFAARAVVAADFDGDGDQDLAAAKENADEVVWYENVEGNGLVWDRWLIDVAVAPIALCAADMDLDGDVDLLAGEFGVSSGPVSWYENVLGDASAWIEVTIKQTVGGPHGVAAGDLDGDGDVDALTAVFLANGIAFHRSEDPAAKVWQTLQLPATGNDYTTVAAVDLDRDGDLDALAASFDVGDLPPFQPVTWFENLNGDASAWQENVIPTTPGKVRQAIAVDLDGDCDLDVVFASSTNDLVGWQENLALFADCNGNGIGDACDIASGTSLDEDGDGVPDECDPPYQNRTPF